MQQSRTKSQAELMTEIESIRSGALARDEDEHTDGGSALGFAIKDQRCDIFAISTPVPRSR
jgi:DNA-binding IclR family transcriptional regulator